MELATSERSREVALTPATPRAPRRPERRARYHYMDATRAFLLTLGVVLHAAWLCQEHGAAFGTIFAGIHSFRMESFFLIAGFFSAMALDTRTITDFVSQRIVRLGVPMLFCGVTAAWWVDIARTQEMRFEAAFDVYFWLGGHWRAHLWFLGTLLAYVGIVFGVHTALPDVDRTIRRHRIGRIAFVSLVTAAYFVGIHLCKVAPRVFGDSRVVLTSGYEVLEYLPFFAGGYYLFLHQDLLDGLIHRVSWNIAGIVLFAVALWTMPQMGAGRYAVQLLKPVYALSVCSLIFWIARRHFDRGGAFIRSFSDASYTIYLMHLPALVVFFKLLELVHVPALVEFLVLTVGTGVLCYYFHTHVVDRVGVLAFLLNGRTTTLSRAPSGYRVSPSHR
jgi:glucan biosynthesis protein C